MQPDDRDHLIEVFHAESLALGEANVQRLTRMLQLIVIGFGGVAGLATVLLSYKREEVYYVAPFVILLLWMSCIRTLSELYMASEYRAFYDAQLARLLDVDDYRFVSWQQIASSRGTSTVANWTVYGFAGFAALLAIFWSAWRTIDLLGVPGWLLAGVWALGVALIAVSALRLPRLRDGVRADLNAFAAAPLLPKP